MVNLKVNGETRTASVPDEKPLLWTLREDLNVNGPKFGFGYGICGACTVLVDGKATRSCITQAKGVENKDILSIEGLNDRIGKALKEAWQSVQVPQCGYCQPGMIVACASAIYSTPSLNKDTIINKVTNICRCGTYHQINEALGKALDTLKKGGHDA